MSPDGLRCPPQDLLAVHQHQFLIPQEGGLRSAAAPSWVLLSCESVCGWQCLCRALSSHLDGVVQGGACGVQWQVLERFDLRCLPAVAVRPVDGQHVVRELFAKHQGGGVRLRLACCVAFDVQICCLRWRRTNHEPVAKKNKEQQTGQEQSRRRVEWLFLNYWHSMLYTRAISGALFRVSPNTNRLVN